MTDQTENSSETPEEPQPEEVVSETPADTPIEETPATEDAEAQTAAVDAEPAEADAPEEAEVVAETTDATEPEQPVEVADAEVEEPTAEATETEATETETAETETAEAETETTETETTETETAEGEVAESDETELTLGSGAPAEEEEVERPAPVIRGKIDKFGVAMGTGRRKSAVARVRIKTGTGEMTINGRSFEEYFCIERDRKMVEAPLHTTETYGKVDVWVRVGGGGTTGQTGAVVLGIARALQAMDPALHYSLADNGYLTRDSRMVERKKYGFKKARKSFQFSKR